MLTVRVDLYKIKHNISYIKSVTNTEFCAVVKANAYGHGLCEFSKAVEEDVDCFAVATEYEALKLVKSGITKKYWFLITVILMKQCQKTLFLPYFPLRGLKL